mgnify:CR=1 FL=1|jgi:hypothetical protein
MQFSWISTRLPCHLDKRRSNFILILETSGFLRKWPSLLEVEIQFSVEAIIKNFKRDSNISKKSYLQLKTKLEGNNTNCISKSGPTRELS